MNARGDEGADWPFPRSVPSCISLHLKTCEEEEMARAGGITNAVNVGIAVQADWENREFISHISLNVRRLFDFLVQFGTHAFPFPTLQNDPSRCRFIYP